MTSPKTRDIATIGQYLMEGPDGPHLLSCQSNHHLVWGIVLGLAPHVCALHPCSLPLSLLCHLSYLSHFVTLTCPVLQGLFLLLLKVIFFAKYLIFTQYYY